MQGTLIDCDTVQIETVYDLINVAFSYQDKKQYFSRSDTLYANTRDCTTMISCTNEILCDQSN